MSFYVYIIQSLIDNSFYRGFTENPLQRLQLHNAGESTYTSRKIPWRYIYIEECPSKKEALIREKVLKKYSRDQIRILVLSSKNVISIFGLE